MISPFNQLISDRRGAVSPLVMGLTSVLLLISMGTLGLTHTQSHAVVNDGERMTALSVAEGGIDHILWRLRQPADAAGHFGPNWRTLSDERDVKIPGGTYHLARLDEDHSGAVRGMLVEGYIPSRTAKDAVASSVYVEVTPRSKTPFNWALFGDRGVSNMGNVYIDSYNSNNGPFDTGPKYENGNVGTNNTAKSSIALSGAVEIHGHVYYPPAGTPGVLRTNGHVLISGGVAPNPKDMSLHPIPPVPSDAIYVQPVRASGKGGVSFVTDSGTKITAPIPPGTYVIRKDASGSSVKMSGASRLDFAGTGKTVVYLEGDLKVSGRGIVNGLNKPPALLVYGMPTCSSFDYSGDSGWNGAIYGPDTDVTMTGVSHHHGAIIGRTLRLTGGTCVHYDEALNDLDDNVEGYKISSWTQVK